MKRNQMWTPSAEDLEVLQTSVGRRLKRTLTSVEPAKIDARIEEIVQEGFMRYLQTISNKPEEVIEKPAAFVATLSYNHGLNTMKNGAAQYRREGLVDSEGMEVAANLSSHGSSSANTVNPLSHTATRETLTCLAAAVSSLTPKQQDLFVRIDIHHERQADVAKADGVRLGSVEKVVDAARAKVWWIIAKSNYDDLCSEFNSLVPGLQRADQPTKKQTVVIARHVRSCSECRAAICEAPFALDLGVLVTAGLTGGGGTAAASSRLVDSPIVAKPLHLADAAISGVKHTVIRFTPGLGGQGSDVAAGGASGAGIAGAGGTALAVGGGKIMALCAGVAATACVASVATGVVAIPHKAKDHTQQSRELVSDQVQNPAATATASSAAATTPPPVAPGKAVAIQKKIDQAHHEKVVAQQKAQAKVAAKKEAAAAAAAPSEQVATNQSTASSSFGFGGSSGATTTSSGSTSSSSSGSTSSSSPPPAQVQTNQSAADSSFGFGG